MKEKALKAYGAIFSNQERILIDGIEYFMERTPSANLRFFKIEGYSFLEQNPRKSSHWAKLAREGHRARSPVDQYNDLLKQQGINTPTLQGETGELRVACDCGYDKMMLVPVPPPSFVSCPRCGKALATGPALGSDAEIGEQWRHQA